MREWPYAKEPFDLKLFVLLFIKKLWIVICAMVLGIVIIGGGHYLNKKVLGGPEEYEITTTYFVKYNNVKEETGEIFNYTNSATWQSLAVTDWIVDRAWEHALEAGMVPEEYAVEKADLKSFFSATLPSDVRIPTSTVRTPDKELTVLLNTGLQQAFADLGQDRSEMDEITVIDTTPLAATDKNIRVRNACILGAVTGLFAASFVLALSIISHDGIFLPDTFTYRYGIPMIGFLGKKEEDLDRETLLNAEYLLKDKENTILLGIGDAAEEKGVLSMLEPVGVTAFLSANPVSRDCYEKLRSAKGILLLVKAGERNAKETEHMLHELQLQDIRITAVLLYAADTGLIKAYRLGKGRK